MGAAKIIIGTTIGAGILLALKYLSGLKKTGDKLDTVTTVHLQPIKPNGLSFTLRIDVLLKNPTEGTLTIKQPYVKVLYGTKEIGTSQIVNKEIEIPAYSPKALDPIFLTVPASGLLTLGDGLFKVLIKKQPAQITTLTMTSIKVGGSFNEYTKTDVTTLNQKA
jgi:hypothetical protein